MQAPSERLYLPNLKSSHTFCLSFVDEPNRSFLVWPESQRSSSVKDMPAAVGIKAQVKPSVHDLIPSSSSQLGLFGSSPGVTIETPHPHNHKATMGCIFSTAAINVFNLVCSSAGRGVDAFIWSRNGIDSSCPFSCLKTATSLRTRLDNWRR